MRSLRSVVAVTIGVKPSPLVPAPRPLEEGVRVRLLALPVIVNPRRERRDTPLDIPVRARLVRVRPQVLAKGAVPVPVLAAPFDGVHVPRFGLEVEPAGEPVLVEVFVAEALHRPNVLLRDLELGQPDGDVDQWLPREPGDRGRAYVLDLDDEVAERGANALGLLPVEPRPLGVVLDDGYSPRHASVSARTAPARPANLRSARSSTEVGPSFTTATLPPARRVTSGSSATGRTSREEPTTRSSRASRASS